MGDVGRLDDGPQGVVAHALRIGFVKGLPLLQHVRKGLAGHGSIDPARADGVRRDAVATHFQGQTAHEAVDAGLGGVVGGAVGLGDLGAH